MHVDKTLVTGIPLDEAGKALVMLHGRGGSANDMLRLRESLQLDDFCIFIPQASNNAWYPYTFLSHPTINEPWLSSALQLITGLIKEMDDHGISSEKIFFLGFSQGACLALEYTARYARRYGGIVSFTGGLIGDKLYYNNYKGNFEKTPVFMSASARDPHVPTDRDEKTAELFRKMNADITLSIYNGSSHTVTKEEIDFVNCNFFNL